MVFDDNSGQFHLAANNQRINIDKLNDVSNETIPHKLITLTFLALDRQHAIMLSPVRQSVRPSVCNTDGSVSEANIRQ